MRIIAGDPETRGVVAVDGVGPARDGQRQRTIPRRFRAQATARQSRQARRYRARVPWRAFCVHLALIEGRCAPSKRMRPRRPRDGGARDAIPPHGRTRHAWRSIAGSCRGRSRGEELGGIGPAPQGRPESKGSAARMVMCQADPRCIQRPVGSITPPPVRRCADGDRSRRPRSPRSDSRRSSRAGAGC